MTDSFYRPFFRLAIVNIISNLMVPLAGLVDVAFLGHLSDIRYLSGVALATVLFNYIYWTFGFLRMGTTGTTAQALGRANADAVLLTLVRNGLLAIAISLLILLLQVPLREIGFALLSATPDVKAAGIEYYNAMILGAPPTLLNFVLLGWFLGRGLASKVLILSAVNNGTMVLFDYLLVVRLGLASAGAGWGTALSQYAMAIAGLVMVASEVKWHRVRAIAPHLLDASALKATFLLNSDILIRTFALLTAFALFTNFSSAMGTVTLATNTLLLQVVSLSAYFIDGIAFSTESYAGVFYGQGDRRFLRKLLYTSGAISLLLGITFALAFNLFPTLFFALLTSHTNVLNEIGQYVPWLFPVLAFGSIAYMLDGYFLGLTQGKVLRRSSLISTLVGFMPVAIVAQYLQNPHLLWFALSLFMAARSITLGMNISKTL